MTTDPASKHENHCRSYSKHFTLGRRLPPLPGILEAPSRKLVALRPTQISVGRSSIGRDMSKSLRVNLSGEDMRAVSFIRAIANVLRF
jgi:hypothetical protein